MREFNSMAISRIFAALGHSLLPPSGNLGHKKCCDKEVNCEESRLKCYSSRVNTIGAGLSTIQSTLSIMDTELCCENLEK